MTANARFIMRATINHTQTRARDHWIVLNAGAPGTCQITVNAPVEPLAPVRIDLGWGSELDRVFSGFVERVIPAESGWFVLFCREWSDALTYNLSVMLRHPSMRQVTDTITEQTGIEFVLPDKKYTQTAIACFYSDGAGLAMLENIGRAFAVPEFVWYQQGNGKVYVGSYQDSFWADKAGFIPAGLMTDQQAGNSAKMVAAPMLRPHAVVDGRRLTGVEFQGTQMTLRW
ncbi:hypothetical protein [Pseudoalteromonas obscura]|uniref:Uncharacterized protein n=1 Tax=Pseudoalteromonas obscura TaxID=3048491 RepID=A0ABT7ES56_9GAMM|nr:hypothetical protein [Pseudoalteromonas sp. P94(2023)]MDK2597892.1 hypothetical protein [Pseudoalteromonas sp. P94(2023)]